MDVYVLQALLIILVAAFLVGILIALLPLINQLKKTARQMEVTAASLNDVVNNELRPLLVRTEKAVGGFEDLEQLIKTEVTEITHKANRLVLIGVKSPLARALIFWTLREVWRKIRRKKKDIGNKQDFFIERG